jgi:hypothetical protein
MEIDEESLRDVLAYYDKIPRIKQGSLSIMIMSRLL